MKLKSDQDIENMKDVELMNWGNDFWRMGLDSFKDGILIENNPYPKNSHEYFYWKQGWECAQGADEIGVGI